MVMPLMKHPQLRGKSFNSTRGYLSVQLQRMSHVIVLFSSGCLQLDASQCHLFGKQAACLTHLCLTIAGLYIYGSVGSGKSLLMDMFIKVLHEHDAVPRRRRVHFNAAMLEVCMVDV